MNQMKSVTAEGIEAEAETETETETEAAPRRRIQIKRKSALRVVLMLVVPLLLLIGGGYYWLASGRYASTDNAAVKQDIVGISAQVAGPVAEVAVKENQRVRRGDLLFRIDPAPFRVALLQAEAQLASARLQERQLVTQAQGTSGDIVGEAANVTITRRALDRQSALLRRGFTTRAHYDDALAAVREAEKDLAAARARAANANAAIAPGEQPSEAAALAAVAKAELDLAHTAVRAPSDGTVASADRLLVGQAVVPGIAMLSLVRSDQAWVEANFKERDLARMTVGQAVKVDIDAYPGLDIRGHVASIGAGTGSEFAVLPAQNANGNWVKVTQRVPVRIAFDGRPARPMIAGLSATVKVDLESTR